MPSLVQHICKLFADDTKLLGIIKNWSDLTTLQSDIDILVKWSQEWQMMFNEDKCKVMFFEKRHYNQLNTGFFLNESEIGLTCEADPHNQHYKFRMTNSDGISHMIEESTTERDLGIQLNNRLKWNNQISYMKANAYAELGKLKRTFSHWTSSTFKTLYCTYVRPKLEYGAVIWNPFNDKEIAEIELVQRNATRLIPQIKTLHYKQRLSAIGISSLRDRRLRGDLIQFFKIYKGLNIVNWVNPISTRPALRSNGPAVNVRGAYHRIERQLIKNCEPRENFLSNRVVPFWNELPDTVINSNSTIIFKNKLDAFLIKNTNFFDTILSTIADRS